MDRSLTQEEELALIDLVQLWLDDQRRRRTASRCEYASEAGCYLAMRLAVLRRRTAYRPYRLVLCFSVENERREMLAIRCQRSRLLRRAPQLNVVANSPSRVESRPASPSVNRNSLLRCARPSEFRMRAAPRSPSITRRRWGVPPTHSS